MCIESRDKRIAREENSLDDSQKLPNIRCCENTAVEDHSGNLWSAML